MLFISVIVPVHNTEKQLPRCIESLLNQKMREIEIILVDDGSTDQSGIICDAYANKDVRIKVFHTPFQGVAMARNVGIQKASCDYIMFVDSDDWVSTDFCKAAYQCAVESNADMVMFLIQRVRVYTFLGMQYEKFNVVRSNMTEGLKIREEAIDLLLREIGNGPCSQLYRKSLFRDILFPEGYLYEDIGTVYKVVWNSTRIYYLKRVLYYYCYRFGSITTIHSVKARKDWIEMTSQQLQDLLFWGYDLEKLEQYRFNIAMSYCIIFGLDKNQDCPGFVNLLKQCNKVPEHFTGKRKILFLLLKYCLPAFDLVCNLWGRRLHFVE